MPTPAWTAKSLASETFLIFRANPRLAIPVLTADLLAFAALHLQHALHQPLFTFVLGSKVSVLSHGGDRFAPTDPDIFKAAVIAAPLIWGTYWFSLWLYTTALATVSAMISSPTRQQITLSYAYLLARVRKQRIFRFSLCLFVGVILAALTLFAATNVPWLFRHLNYDAGILLGLLIQVPLICFFAPRALRLISSEDGLLGFNAKMLATGAGLIAITSQMAIAWLLARAVPPIFYHQTSIPGLLLREALTSLLAALSFVPFFIALSLLASDQQVPSEFTLAYPDAPIAQDPAS